MFKNQLALALRNLSKRKGFTIFNILGLTIGITLFRTINCESAVCNRQSAIANLQSPIAIVSRFAHHSAKTAVKFFVLRNNVMQVVF